MADITPAPPHHEEEGDVCRVCRVEGDETDPLIYPCKCSGSVRFVHQDCLKQWLAQTGKKHCEICGHKYTFTKIYPDQLPESIPLVVYIRQSLYWLYRQQLWVARCILVVTTWLIILPSMNMFSLRSLLWITDHIGYTGPEPTESLDTLFKVTFPNSNVSEVIISNITEHVQHNITSSGEASSISNISKGISVGDVVDRPMSTLFGVLRGAFEKWMKGDENSVVSFVLRGQVLSITLAAVLIGLILLREWITQHNWQEGARPQVVEQGDINPDEWMIVNGIARRTTDVMAALLGKARQDRERRVPIPRLGREQEREIARLRRQQATTRHIREQIDAQMDAQLASPIASPIDSEEEEEPNAQDQDAIGAEPDEAGGSLGKYDIKYPRSDDGEPLFVGRPIPSEPDAIASALQEYRQSHRLAERRAEEALPSTRENDLAGQAFDTLLDQALSGSQLPVSRTSSRNAFEGESEAGQSQPRVKRTNTGKSREESSDLIEEKKQARQSFKEREEVAYKAPELLKKGKNKEEVSENHIAGPSNNNYPSEGDIPLFLPASRSRSSSSTSSTSTSKNNIFRAGETIRFDESGNLLHELPRPATPDRNPFIQEPEGAESAEEHDGEWEDEREAGLDEEADRHGRAPADGIEGPADDLEEADLRPAQVQLMEEIEGEPWDRDDWNGMLEVVGLIGPLHGLFQNVLFGVIIMSASISIFIGLPLLIGKLFLSTDLIRSSLSIAGRTLYLIRKVTDPIVDIIFEIVKEVVALPLIASVRAAENLLARKLGLESGSKANILAKLSSIVSSTSSSSTSVGSEEKGRYVTLLADGLAWVGQNTFDAYQSYIDGKRKISISDAVSDRVLMVFSGYGVAGGIVGLIALPGENGGAISKELSKIVKEHAMFLKLAFFMVLELGAFPLGIGMMIDGCTVPLWSGVTLLSRLEKLKAGPFGVMFLDWLIGTMFMYQFATLLSHIRTLCRPGTLFFIRDPADPNYSPVKDIVDKSAFSQLRKLGTSAVMYAVIVFTLFGGSCWTLAYLPRVDFLPLRVDPTFGPLTSIPFDLLFLHLVVPPTVTIIRPRHRMRKILTVWWKSTINLVRLNTLMAKRSTSTDHKTLNDEPSRIDKVWPILDPICQLMFGKYNPTTTRARVPSSDQVILLPPAQRKAEGGVFIALNEEGVPNSPEDKMRLLKQDRRAREAGREPSRDYEVIRLPQYWRTRVHTFIGVTLLMAATVIATAVFGPVAVGRLASSFISNGSAKKIHDGYNWLFGAYIIHLSFSLGLTARRHILTLSKAGRLRRSGRSTRIKRTIMRFLAGTYGLLLVYGVIPIAVGLLGDIYGSTFSWTRKAGEGGRLLIHFWDTWAMGTVICSLAVGLMKNISRFRPARSSRLDNLKERFQNPIPKDFSSTHQILPTIGYLLIPVVSPFVITALIVLASKGKYSDEVYQGLLLAIIPLLLRILVIVLIRQWFSSGWSTMRQQMIDAEYVVEEKVENYDPSLEDKKRKIREAKGKAKKADLHGNEDEPVSDEDKQKGMDEEEEQEEHDWEDTVDEVADEDDDNDEIFKVD
ncbi:uncharacterized protein IL334_005857 [Kwoniella shivajii]|uniref:RING-type E3 ubiquitin transferase n=1 Tax=Kwoniella shivajii TaxID=564305 RepID=A0ABZ1D4A7_9TREE|nr:hypothetical protein IL334_005857 [Kwoniella shivajii]